MNAGHMRHFAAISGLLLVIGAIGIAQGADPGRIVEVKATEDFRRVIIRCQGMVEPPAAYELAEPSRLVIDFLHAGMGDVEGKKEYVGQSIREIRTGKLPKGSRLVVDFGENPVPQYQIRQIDNYFVVFLSDVPMEPAASAAPAPIRNAPIWEETPFPVTAASDPGPTDISGLVIKSAKVVKGMIVLEVENQSGQPKSYRVDIGIDFDQMGFHTAAVRRMKGITRRRATGSTHASARGQNYPAGPPVQGEHYPVRDPNQYNGSETVPCLVSGISSSPQQNTW